MSTNSSIIKADQIIKKYGKRTVVKGISMQVQQGGNCWPFRPKWRWKDNEFLYDLRLNSTK